MSDEKTQDRTERYAGFEELPVEVIVRVGGCRCPLGEIASLSPGEVIRLDQEVGQPFAFRAGDVLLGGVEPVSQEDGVAVKLVEVNEETDVAG